MLGPEGDCAVFVPDEEAARGIEAWADAVQAIRTGDLWPGWPPTGTAFGLMLPGGAGLCVIGADPALGRPVAARSGGALAHVRHVNWEDVRSPRAPSLEGESEATVALPGGPVHVVATSVGGSPAMARALATRAFGRWWSDLRGKASAEDGPPPAPEISPERAALATVEGRLLLRALTEDDFVTLALQIALVRRERRGTMEDEKIAAEDRWEVDQGIRAYIGHKAAAMLGAGPERQMPAQLTEFGGLPPGRRGRLSGWALAHLLDRLEDVVGRTEPSPARTRAWAPRANFSEGWKAALGNGSGVGLQILLESFVRFDGGSRDDAALERALAAAGHPELLQAERARAAESARARQALVDDILRGGGTLMVFDVASLGAAQVDAPAPAQSIHTGMAVYPEGASFQYAGGTRLRFRGVPLAEDRRSGLLQARVAARLRLGGDGANIRPDAEAIFEQGLHLRLPGVEVQARTGLIRPIEGGYLIRVMS